jgi:hypothetical protein
MEEFKTLLHSSDPLGLDEIRKLHAEQETAFENHERYEKMDFSKLETGLEGIDETIENFKKQNPPKEEPYVPNSSKDDEDLKDKV